MTSASKTKTLSETFDLAAVIKGLARDLKDRRAGNITIEDARVRAEMAKQIYNGLRILITAQKFLEQSMKQLPARPAK